MQTLLVLSSMCLERRTLPEALFRYCSMLCRRLCTLRFVNDLLTLQGNAESAAFWRRHNPAALDMVESHFQKHEGQLVVWWKHDSMNVIWSGCRELCILLSLPKS